MKKRKVHFRFWSPCFMLPVLMFILMTMISCLVYSEEGRLPPGTFALTACALVFSLILNSGHPQQLRIIQSGEEVPGRIEDIVPGWRGTARLKISYRYREKEFTDLSHTYYRSTMKASLLKPKQVVRIFVDPNEPHRFAILEASPFYLENEDA